MCKWNYFRLFFTLMIRRNQVTYYSTHTCWWKNSQFWLQSERCSPRQELHADMHAIRMIYANYAYYSQRNPSSNCQDKLPEISHKICRARSKRWRPLGKQGHSASGAFQEMMMIKILFSITLRKRCGLFSLDWLNVFSLLQITRQIKNHFILSENIRNDDWGTISCLKGKNTSKLLHY